METLNKVFKTSDVPLLDRYTIENEKIKSWDLMERAAAAWVTFFNKMCKSDACVNIIAGQGNNGGDGFAIARMLKLQGRQVKVITLNTHHAKSPDCSKNTGLWEEMQGEVVALNQPSDWLPSKDTVLIDALFGSGLNRPLSGIYAEFIKYMNQLPNQVFAVDIPSGLMGEDNSQNDRDAIVRADVTLTFQFPKLAFMLPENESFVGDWRVVDIKLSTDAVPTFWFLTEFSAVQSLLPVPGKFDHKGTNGRGLLVAGSQGMMGAAVLAARGALHSGIGLLHCHVPSSAADIMQIAVPEALLDIDRSAACFSGADDLERYDAIAVGPGLGQCQSSVDALKALLHDWRGRLILDADAINIVAAHPEMLQTLRNHCILTPHFKEFERLAGKCANDFDRINKLSKFAKQYGVYVILKGAYSVVATPDEKLFFNRSGNAGMAKGGCGDVLTGVLLALSAGKMELEQVARVGAFVHGLSADILLEEYGMRSITSGMVADGLGHAWKKLEK